jgi:hypothetical protein
MAHGPGALFVKYDNAVNAGAYTRWCSQFIEVAGSLDAGGLVSLRSMSSNKGRQRLFFESDVYLADGH